MSTIKQKENQLEQCQSENTRLRDIEANFENVQVAMKWLRRLDECFMSAGALISFLPYFFRFFVAFCSFIVFLSCYISCRSFLFVIVSLNHIKFIN